MHSGCSKTSRGEDDAIWFAKYLAEDTPSSVEDRVARLGEAGLEDAACHWHHLNFAIIGARKP